MPDLILGLGIAGTSALIGISVLFLFLIAAELLLDYMIVMLPNVSYSPDIL